MRVNSAENMGHNLPLLQFSMTGPPPRVHHNNHQQNVTENIQVNQSNNHFIRNHTNQPLSPTFSTAPMPSPSYPFNVPQDGERNYENL